jgi:hypothetical protein
MQARTTHEIAAEAMLWELLVVAAWLEDRAFG